MWGKAMKKLFISQPMRGREYDAIMAERKALIADAAVALRTDDVEALDTYFQHFGQAAAAAACLVARKDGGRRRGDFFAGLAGRPWLPGGAPGSCRVRRAHH